MVFLIAAFLALVVTTILVAPLTVERSGFRASAHQAPILFGLISVVVAYSLVANTTVLDRLFYTTDLERASGVALSSVFSPAAFLPTAGSEPLYLVSLWALAHLGTTTAVFFAFIGIASSAIYLWPLVRLLSWWQATFVFFLALSLGTFTSYTSIAAKQSIAMALLSAALCWAFIGRRRTLAVALAVAACFIHWSAIPFALILLIVARFHIPIRLALAGWVIAAVAFITGTQTRLLGGATAYIPKLEDYTAGGLASVYRGGVNRVDFLAFGALMLVAFLLLRRFLDLPEWYTKVLVVFIANSTLFLMLGFVYYSDRLAAYSWYLAPLLAAAPVFARTTPTSKALAASLTIVAVVATAFTGPFALSSPLWALS